MTEEIQLLILCYLVYYGLFAWYALKKGQPNKRRNLLIHSLIHISYSSILLYCLFIRLNLSYMSLFWFFLLLIVLFHHCVLLLFLVIRRTKTN